MTRHHRARPARIVAAFVALACAPSTSEAREVRPPAPIDTGALLAELRREMTSRGVPGASIAVVQDGRVVLARGLGLRSVETGDSMTANSLVRIGSITKSFTGLAVLLLEQRGRLRRERAIRTIAPDLPPALADRTLEQLLTHTAGFSNEGAGNGAQDDAALGSRVMGWDASRYFAAPGDVYSYSSPGYWLAGYLVERAAGVPYADAMDSLVFAPLGMRRTTLRPTMAMTFPLAVDHRGGFTDAAMVLRPIPNDASTWPSGSIFSSVEDLARYAIALMDDGRLDGRQALPAGVVGPMLRGAASVPGSDCAYSTGFSVCVRGGVTTAGHYGFRTGSGAILTLVPQRRLAIVILANRGGAIMHATEARFLAMAGLRESDDDASCDASRPTVARRELIGVYEQGADTMRVVEQADGVGLEHHAPALRLVATAPDTFLAVDGQGCAQRQLVLVRSPDGSRTYLHDGLHAYRRR